MISSEHFKKLPELDELLKLIRNEIMNGKRPATETLLDEVDLCAYLKVSKRHAANLRAKRLITFSKSGGKIYYRLSDVIAFIEQNEVKAIHASHNLLTSKSKKHA